MTSWRNTLLHAEFAAIVAAVLLAAWNGATAVLHFSLAVTTAML